jgi:hypothetical protein
MAKNLRGSPIGSALSTAVVVAIAILQLVPDVRYQPTCLNAPNFTSAAKSSAITTAQPSSERLLCGFSCIDSFAIYQTSYMPVF